MTPVAAVADLREELLTGRPKPSAAYAAKQLHDVPRVPVVSRVRFLLDRATGRHVLDIGASGPVSLALRQVAASYLGWDREPWAGATAIDLDAYGGAFEIPQTVDLVICGEVLEHLSNPGWFLDRLRTATEAPMIVTVPNAFSAGGLAALNQGIENVNRDHVAYYSWWTLTNLVTRHGFRVLEWYWYHGHPKFAEGLILVVRRGET